MFASKNLLATVVLCLGLSIQVYAHAGVTPALGVNGKFVRNDVQRPSRGNECGNVDIAKNLDSSTAISLAANGTFSATITNFNGGVDGSRQVTAVVDPSGTGKSFVSADVLQNGDKNPNGTGSQQLVVQLPTGTRCTGGEPKNKCLVSFTTAGGFGNCVVVQQSASVTPPKGTEGTARGGNAAADPGASPLPGTPSSVKSTATVSGSSATASLTPIQIDEELEKELQELEQEIQEKIKQDNPSSASKSRRAPQFIKDA